MAITAMGLGTKQPPTDTNLDPQRQFWSWMIPFVHPKEQAADSHHHDRGYFCGFACTQTNPVGMSVKIGGGSEPDSALLVLSNGNCVLLSTDGEPEVVPIPTAPASGSRIDAVVTYIDKSSPKPDAETPGTPEYVHTIVVSGTTSSAPSAPTDSQIVAALPSGASGKYYRWCDVRVGQGVTTITNSNITDRKPASPNVYWTKSDIKDIANSEANTVAGNLVKRKAPYVGSVSSYRSNTNKFSLTARPASDGYKFLVWVYTTTTGAVATWNAEHPEMRTTDFFYVAPANWPGSHTVVSYALYVPA